MDVVRIAGIDLPVSGRLNHWVPQTNLVLTPTTVRNLQKIIHPLKAGYPLLLVGDAGVGKNALIYYINSLRKHPTIRYSFNEDTLPEDLVGAYRIDPRRAFVWSDGPLVRAMREGSLFVADEMNLAPPEVLKRFLSVFTENSIQLLEGDSTTLKAVDGFHFIGTQNPAEGFEGRKNLPREIQKYFVTIFIDAYPDEELIDILSGLYPDVSRELLTALVKVNGLIEHALLKRDIGSRDLERYHFNLRNMGRMTARISNAGSAMSGAAENLIRQEIEDTYALPFRSAEDRDKVRGIIQSVIPDFEVKKTTPRIQVGTDSFSIGRSEIGPFKLEKSKVESAMDAFPPVSSRLSLLESIARAIELKENILLESEPDVEPDQYVEFFAGMLGANLAVVNLSRGMHTSDVIGGLKPVRARELAWVDGPLTRAIRNGDLILIRGLEAAGPELVEKLNMLLDDARALLLPPESGEEKPLQLKDTSIIFAVKVFRITKSVTTISRAFRNRFTSIIVPPISDRESLVEIALHALRDPEGSSLAQLATSLVAFHLQIRTAASSRDIGSGNMQAYAYGLTNLQRMCNLIAEGSGETADLFRDTIIRSAGISYLNEIADPMERQKMFQALERILAGIPLEEITQAAQELKKKAIIQKRSFSNKIDWDKAQHFRDPNTGRAERKLNGDELKKGIRIDTPETGGNAKEGPDAWYGSDTQGNMGQGEPGHGGGGYGYRTEELYKEFLKKRRALWEYNLGVSLQDFHEVFGPEIERVVIDFDRLLDPRTDIHRRYQDHGSRVDGRRYLAYISGKGDGRVFDKTTVTLERDRLKGVEIIFALNKGRRMFNFEYSIATLVSILSTTIIMSNHKVPIAVCGYSDLTNHKRDIDMIWYKNLDDDYTPTAEEHLFSNLSQDWHGDTIPEADILTQLADSFSSEATTKILIMLSDFRGARAKMNPEATAASKEGVDLKQGTEQLERRDIHMLGVGLGPKNLADYFFPEHFSVNSENYANLPVLLSNKLSEMIHRYHRS